MTKSVFTHFFLLFNMAPGEFKMAHGSRCVSIGQRGAGSPPRHGPPHLPCVREAGLPLGSGRRACGEMARLLHCQLLGEQILSTDIKLLFAPTFIYKMPNPKKLCRLL